jgi:hypothetical protein
MFVAVAVSLVQYLSTYLLHAPTLYGSHAPHDSRCPALGGRRCDPGAPMGVLAWGESAYICSPGVTGNTLGTPGCMGGGTGGTWKSSDFHASLGDTVDLAVKGADPVLWYALGAVVGRSRPLPPTTPPDALKGIVPELGMPPDREMRAEGDCRAGWECMSMFNGQEMHRCCACGDNLGGC